MNFNQSTGVSHLVIVIQKHQLIDENLKKCGKLLNKRNSQMTQLTPLSAPQANNCHTFRLSNLKPPTGLLMASSPEPALNQCQFSPSRGTWFSLL